MKLTPPDVLTPPEKSLFTYLKANHHRPEFAVARRQQWPKVLAMLTKALDKLLEAHLAFTRQRVLAGMFYMSGTGGVSAQQIEANQLLNAEEKAQCQQLLAIYLTANPSPPLSTSADEKTSAPASAD